MEKFSGLLALCAGNPLFSGEFPAQRPVTRSFDVFFDLHLIKWLSKHSPAWWFETLSSPLWRHCNDFCPCPWEISKQHHYNTNCQSRAFQTSRDLTIRRIIGYRMCEHAQNLELTCAEVFELWRRALRNSGCRVLTETVFTQMRP